MKVIVKRKEGEKYYVYFPYSLDDQAVQDLHGTVESLIKEVEDTSSYIMESNFHKSGFGKRIDCKTVTKGHIELYAETKSERMPGPASTQHTIEAHWRGHRLGCWYVFSAPNNLGIGLGAITERICERVSEIVQRGHLRISDLGGLDVVVNEYDLYKRLNEWQTTNRLLSVSDAEWILAVLLMSMGDVGKLIKDVDKIPREVKDAMGCILKTETLEELRFVITKDGELARRRRKMELALLDRLEQAFEPLPSKEVSWKVVRNIANNLTKQLYLGDGVDIEQAHLSDFNQGPVREFTLEKGRQSHWRDAGWDDQGWHAFDEDDVSELYWEAGRSGSGLIAKKKGDNRWSICFIPSKNDPTYRGNYFVLYEEAEQIENIILTDDW